MKKRGVLLGLLFVLMFFLIFSKTTSALGNATFAYQCLTDKVHGKCSTLNLEERIFSLLAINECKSEIVLDSANGECWPKSGCNLKTTSQAVLALDKTGFNTQKAIDWILSQKKIPSDVSWFLQIDSPSEVTCNVAFDGGSYEVIINSDKKITSQSIIAGPDCFSKAQDDYWLEISPTCLDKEFEVSCNDAFSSNLIFKLRDSDVFYVSSDTSTSQASGKTIEKVNSFCFSSGGACSYEGSLWAAFTLTTLGEYEKVKPFLPYLITLSEKNEKFIPDSFLYFITHSSEYRSSLLSKQKFNKYWQGDTSNNKFYDTAVALYSLISDNPTQKTNAKNWLLDSQGANGCWENNIRNTAFILHSAWQDQAPNTPTCFDNTDCTGGNICLYGECAPKGSVCVVNQNCKSPEPFCVNYKCVECNYDGDCDSTKNEICTTDNVCGLKKECTTNAQCSIGQVCSLSGFCIGAATSCTNNSQCGSNLCLNGTCADCGPTKSCSSGYSCSSANRCIFNDNDEDEICDSSLGQACRDKSSCIGDGGEVLGDLDCSYPLFCCSVEKEETTCFGEGGVICSSSQICDAGIKDYTDDLQTGQSCCIGGTCKNAVTELSSCELDGGDCKSACSDSEDEGSLDCADSGDVCCVSKPVSSTNSRLWLWIFGVLIVLTIVAIIFRDKLRILMMRFGSSSKKGPVGGNNFRPTFPSPSSSLGMRRPLQRRILPPQLHQPPQLSSSLRRPIPQSGSKPVKKGSNELDDVLKKLKEIGK